MTYCTQCGSPITSDSPAGLCARCLMRAAVKETPPPWPPPPPSPGGVATQPGPAGGGDSAAARIDIGDPARVAERLPQFEILGLLGRGGMGVVYKARQVQLDRVVALKILPPAEAASPGFVERFRREARSLAKLNPPNIVAVHDYGEAHGLYYFVMEYVDGLNLRQVLRAGRLAAPEALALVPKICDALQFAHEEGVVHRDVKPENILIDQRGRVKIADFGLAKLLGRGEADPRLTVTGATMGTPRYMAPEQFESPERVDHRADIYSLGVVFYEMLTGELPVGRFAPPSRKVRVDVRLDEIVLHALERDVELRYQHASQVRDDVEEVNGHPGVLPTLAAPPAAFNGVDPAAGLRRPGGPRLSRLALSGAVWVPVFFVILVIVFSFPSREAAPTGIPKGDGGGVYLNQGRSLPWAMLPLFFLVGTSVIGAIAVGQIKHSGGTLYGLRLAALEAILFPVVLLFLAAAIPCNELLTSIGHLDDVAANSVGVPAALLVCFFAARAAWRAIVGRPAPPP